MELVETSSGWTTFSSRMFVMQPLRTLMPAVFSPWACLGVASEKALDTYVYLLDADASLGSTLVTSCDPS